MCLPWLLLRLLWLGFELRLNTPMDLSMHTLHPPPLVLLTIYLILDKQASCYLLLGLLALDSPPLLLFLLHLHNRLQLPLHYKFRPYRLLHLLWMDFVSHWNMHSDLSTHTLRLQLSGQRLSGSQDGLLALS